MPEFPADVTTSYHDGPLGRMRSRAVGERRPGVPEIVLVQGMAVANYLLPGLAAWGEWTRAHLVEIRAWLGWYWPVPPSTRLRAGWSPCSYAGAAMSVRTRPAWPSRTSRNGNAPESAGSSTSFGYTSGTPSRTR